MSTPERESSKPSSDHPSFVGNERAPFIYCDATYAMGVENGVIHLELASRTAVPTLQQTIAYQYVAAAHLRCSIASAKHLRDCLDKAIAMAAPTEGQEPPKTELGTLH